ncbi:unnamed protein product [Amoebophrya sp. A25]|nr:unnamed protein product [Amoebophrya sp. A25]|eukprot:GSA25T00024094001.1
MRSLPTTLFIRLAALAQVCESRTTTPQVPQQVLEEEAQEAQTTREQALMAGEARHHEVAGEVAGFLQPQTRADPSPTSPSNVEMEASTSRSHVRGAGQVRHDILARTRTDIDENNLVVPKAPPGSLHLGPSVPPAVPKAPPGSLHQGPVPRPGVHQGPPPALDDHDTRYAAELNEPAFDLWRLVTENSLVSSIMDQIVENESDLENEEQEEQQVEDRPLRDRSFLFSINIEQLERRVPDWYPDQRLIGG